MSKVYIVIFNTYRTGYGKCDCVIKRVFYQLEDAQNYIESQGYPMRNDRQSHSQLETTLGEYTTKYIIEDHNVRGVTETTKA